ncbi:peptidoglycan DD-metalloendopeptidase family protein [Marinicellulosiphila megalodicopiae]|uniref:peptidoglycan DD-metalloendopeptidase family protein n=1 Tax=Marinicellulosiphila megalodicopiae TaxID=2724896 RepID=UPI003BB09809
MTSKAFPKIHTLAILITIVIIFLVIIWPSSEPNLVVIKVVPTQQPFQVNSKVEFYSNVQATVNETNSIESEPDFAKINPIEVKKLQNDLHQNTDIELATVPKPVKAPIIITVKKEDTLSHIFERSGAGVRLMMNLLNNKSIKQTITPIKPGEKIEFHFDENEDIAQVHLVHDAKYSVVITGIVEKKYGIEQRVAKSEIKTHFKSAAIELSLFGSAEKAGINANLTAQIMHIFGWDIDFGQDLRQGDHLSVLYEQEYINGESYGNGTVIASQFFNKDELFQATLFTDSSGRTDYYNQDGKSMKKSFLRTPVDASRVSSSFSKKRFHPVHQTYKRHTGTDYAAPSGTSIKASGDGKIIFAGVKGGYGNAIIIQHQQGITTLYAHMKNFKRGMRVGTKVSQGDVIGFVGKSGTATGYHLHYEFRVNGVHQNPETVKLPKAEPINKKYLAEYMDHANFLLNKLNAQRIAFQQMDELSNSQEIL